LQLSWITLSWAFYGPRQREFIQVTVQTLTLKCINCGANLEISEDMTRFACGYCGTEQLVQRRGGTVALKPIANAIARVQAGTDKTAAELAIRRLKEELNDINHKYNQRVGEANVQRSRIGNESLWILAIACAVGVVFIKDIGCPGALIILGIGIAISLFNRHQGHQPINEDLERDLEPIRLEATKIREKIELNKTLIDS
jgi:predicted RNA-binding Zn-ribbon protein involved in translation (DUF1610 family)